MKKIVFLFSIFVLMIAILEQNNTPIFAIFDEYSGEYYCYTSQNFTCDWANTVPNGNEYIISCSIDRAHLLNAMLDDNKIRGESFVLNGVDNIDVILKQLGIQYYGNNGSEILAYSCLVPYSVKVDNKYYNVQLFERNDDVVVGFPMILGSF